MKHFLMLFLVLMVITKIQLDRTDKTNICIDTIVKIDTAMITDYLCWNGKDFSRCDPEALAKEIMGKEP